MPTSWHSYPSVYNMGHRAISKLLELQVNVEEKIDGSQFSFGMFKDPEFEVLTGEELYGLKVRSKGAVMHPDAPQKMFKRAVDHVKSIQHLLTPGWTYRGECLDKPKHNTLAYDRFPKGHVILFDINDGEESYLNYEAKLQEATRLGFECVPRLFCGKIDTIDQFRQFLSQVSVLGGQNIEGVVVKPKDYNLFGLDKKVLFGKFVSEAFKEVHSKAWREGNPTSGDIILELGSKYSVPARWNKAIQHLREAGKLEDSVRDIGLIIREIPADIKKEHEDEIKDQLFKWAWPHISRMTSKGFPEFYKELLLARSFEEKGVDETHE